MQPSTIMYLAGLLAFVPFAILTYKQHPFLLFSSGLGITIFGSLFGVDMISYGQTSQSQHFEGLGQSFLIVISVVGGGVISASVSELRAKHQTKING